MGIPNLPDLNLCLIGSWIKRYIQGKELPRKKVINAKYDTRNPNTRKQITLMDKFREAMDITSQRIIIAESCLLVMGDKRIELMEENDALKKKIAEYEAKALADEDPEEVTLYNTDGEEITVDEWEARAVKKAKEPRVARLEEKRRKTLPLACLGRIKRG
jgi:hypothetical protein